MPANGRAAAHAETRPAPRSALAPYYAELGIDPTDNPVDRGRLPFSNDVADLVAPLAPRIVRSHSSAARRAASRIA
ncbi:MAG TPA: hypothetical protein PLC86_15810 [Candidatus Accumulibacter phosphatis]|nr:hypothetical protein [Candidatus Accumulibacter phosphatis]